MSTLNYCYSRMTGKRPVYKAWQERIESAEKGNRIIQFYLASTSGSALLAAEGTERSGRHFIYQVSKEFLETFGSSPTVNADTKWTARRHVLNLLRSVINDNPSPTKRDLHLVPNHQGSSCQKRVRSLEEYLVMRIAKRPRSSIVRQGQNSSSSDVIAASQAAGAQHFASFVVGDEIEVLCQEDGKLCQGSDMRSCWFRCKVINISKNCLKVQYNDLVTKNGSGNLEKCFATPRLAPADKQSMRLPGRLTIRPCPDEEPPTSFEVGAAVDAWWNNCWWEGFVTTGVSLTDNDKYYVVIPGQRKYLTLHRKDLRASMEWVDETWVPLKSHPDIISFVIEHLGS